MIDFEISLENGQYVTKEGWTRRKDGHGIILEFTVALQIFLCTSFHKNLEKYYFGKFIKFYNEVNRKLGDNKKRNEIFEFFPSLLYLLSLCICLIAQTFKLKLKKTLKKLFKI